MVEKEETLISEEEAAQYDRQIRLWGLDAQKRLRASRVLLVGMRGLGAEVAKNLILAGVKGLTMLDHEQVTEESSRAQFLIPVGSEGQNRAQTSLERAQYLNPMVEVKADPESAESKPEDFFLQFDAVCLTCCPRDLLVRVDQICTKNNVKFFSGDVFGYHGYMFSNLGPEHHYVEEKPKVVKPAEEVDDGPEAKKPKIDPSKTAMVKKTASFCSLKEALEVDWTSEKAKAALKRTPADYFLLQVVFQDGIVSDGRQGVCSLSGGNRSRRAQPCGVVQFTDSRWQEVTGRGGSFSSRLYVSGCLQDLGILRCSITKDQMEVLLKFRTDKGRDPHPESFTDDSQLLLQIRDDVLDSLGLGTELVPDEFVSYCFSEMSPVCAVLGGVLGQEIVKALSQRDAPHKNFFFFDGWKGTGVVDCLGEK
ncbi:SAE1 enzyme, partial [Atractosteus spatula]|nr:SAE1 enzyme [Atractosteus spatula]